MTAFNGEQYAARTPIYEADLGTKNRQSPTMTIISEKQIPGCNYYIELGWVYGIPEPNPHIHEHVHDFDEIVLQAMRKRLLKLRRSKRRLTRPSNRTRV